jgi:hypothetical protein
MHQGTFTSIDCRSATNCVAVGTVHRGAVTYAISAQLSGSSLNLLSMPAPLVGPSSVVVATSPVGVSCVSGGACSAVGSVISSAGTSPFVARLY